MGFQYKRIGSAPTDAHDGGVFDKFSNYQLEKQGQIYNHVEIPPEGHTATGGTVGDYMTQVEIIIEFIFFQNLELLRYHHFQTLMLLL